MADEPKPADAGFGFAKRKARGNIRKRQLEEEPEGEDTGVVRSTKSAKDSALAFTTKRAAEKAEPFKFESSRTLQQEGNTDATRTLETETEFDRDARALREQVLKQATEEGAAAADGMYKGANNYIDYRKGFRREHTVGAEKGTGLHGPLRANINMRLSVRIDYQPDVCKDYKETGFCGYGDACKFVHDRSDYKSGWELEKQWEEQEKERQAKAREAWAREVEGGGPASDAEDEEEDDLPFACFICRKPWEQCQDPVVTRCKHYFCEQCALRHNMRSGKCFVCELPTNGIFNVAHEITRKTKKKDKTSEAPAQE